MKQQTIEQLNAGGKLGEEKGEKRGEKAGGGLLWPGQERGGKEERSFTREFVEQGVGGGKFNNGVWVHGELDETNICPPQGKKSKRCLGNEVWGVTLKNCTLAPKKVGGREKKEL